MKYDIDPLNWQSPFSLPVNENILIIDRCGFIEATIWSGESKEDFLKRSKMLEGEIIAWCYPPMVWVKENE